MFEKKLRKNRKKIGNSAAKEGDMYVEEGEISPLERKNRDIIQYIPQKPMIRSSEYYYFLRVITTYITSSTRPVTCSYRICALLVCITKGFDLFVCSPCVVVRCTQIWGKTHKNTNKLNSNYSNYSNYEDRSTVRWKNTLRHQRSHTTDVRAIQDTIATTNYYYYFYYCTIRVLIPSQSSNARTEVFFELLIIRLMIITL